MDNLGTLSDIFNKVTTTVDKYTPLAQSAFNTYQTIAQSGGPGTSGQQVPQQFNPANYQVVQPIQPIQKPAPQAAGMSTGTKVLIGLGLVTLIGGTVYFATS